jgi:hypothetical protein
MALIGNSSQLPPRLQLLIDSLPCFTTLFQGYLPLHQERRLSALILHSAIFGNVVVLVLPPHCGYIFYYDNEAKVTLRQMFLLAPYSSLWKATSRAPLKQNRVSV